MPGQLFGMNEMLVEPKKQKHLRRRATPRDPVLMELAHKLKAVGFDKHQEFKNILHSPDHSVLHNVALFPRNGYMVRFNVLGFHQIFGRSLDDVTACRFADMCVRRLDRFRSKKYPARYNFSEEQAIEDEKNCPAARELLDQIEARVVTMQQENAPRQDRIGKLEAAVSDNLAQLCRRIEKLEKSLGL
jgi:hypothetical protein